MSNGFASQSGMDLFGLFVNNFDTNVIYEMGWYAAQQWTVLISGTVMALAIGIRMTQEKLALIGEGRANYTKAVMNIIVIAVAIGLYFVLVALIIQFFNAIYGALDASDSLKMLTEKLDRILAMLLEKEYNFAWSDVVDSLYAVFATCTYAITYCVLVFMVLAMRVAHAVLVSFCVFWGAVALPMAIATGHKTLSSFWTLCLLSLFWPIVDAFFMYLIGGSFSVMLDRSDLGLESVDTWSMGTLLFYMAAFSIINIFLAATTFSAPFIAQAIATGSGNVTGMLGAFGTAGLAAGVTAASYLKKGGNSIGNTAGGLLQQGGDKLATKLEKVHNNLRGLSGGGATPVDTGKWFQGDNPSGSNLTGATPKPAGPSNRPERPAAGEASNNRSASNQHSSTSSPRTSSVATHKPATSNDLSTAADRTPPKNPLSPSDRENARVQRRQQGRRGAIINRKKKS